MVRNLILAAIVASTTSTGQIQNVFVVSILFASILLNYKVDLFKLKNENLMYTMVVCVIVVTYNFHWTKTDGSNDTTIWTLFLFNISMVVLLVFALIWKSLKEKIISKVRTR
jgi:Na+/proline symporter